MKWTRPWRELPAWLGLLFGGVGIVSLFLTLLFNLVLDRPVLRLEMARTSYLAFAQQTLATPSGHSVQAQVLFDGKPVDGLQQVVFAVRNAGNGVVTHSPDERLYVEFPKTVTLLTADLGGTPEGDLSFAVRAAAEEHRVYVDFARLKPREDFSLSVFFIGDLGSDSPRLKGRSLAALDTVVRLAMDKPAAGASAAAPAAAGVAIAAALFGLVWFVLGSARKNKAEAQEANFRTALADITAEMRKFVEELDKELPKLWVRRTTRVAGPDEAVQEPPTGQSEVT